MLWAALAMVTAMIGVSASAWYFTGRLESARRAGTQVRFARRAAWIPVAAGAVTIAEGVAAFVITGDWVVLPPTACLGLLTGAIGVRVLSRLRRASGGTGEDSP